MAFEDIILSEPAQFALNKAGRMLLNREAERCSGRIIFPQPTRLEPPYVPLNSTRDISYLLSGQSDILYEPDLQGREIIRNDILPSSDYQYRWDVADVFIRHLPALHCRSGIEITGNCKNIKFRHVCDKNDWPVLSSCFGGNYTECIIKSSSSSIVDHDYHFLILRDYVYPGIYSHLFTQPNAFKVSAYTTFLYILANLPEDMTGICQVIYEPVARDHNWHHNVELLTDIEYQCKLMPNASRYPQQLPSGELRGTSAEIDIKSHLDKSFFAAALRIAVFGDNKEKCQEKLQTLCSFTNLFRHGGRPLEYIDCSRYNHVDKKEMLQEALVYHPGMLLNSTELCGLVHVPPIDFLKNRNVMEIVSPTFKNITDISTKTANDGIIIGHRQTDLGLEEFVIPDKDRNKHTHILGSPGKGKSISIENMVLNDIEKGHGVAVIDPHGDLVERLLDRIPENMVSKTILFDQNDNRWIPLYNPLDAQGGDIDVAADNIVCILKSVYPEHWGLRMEHVLKNAITGLMNLKGMSFSDLASLVRKGKKSEKLVKLIKENVTNDAVIDFFSEEFNTYKKEEISSALHRISTFISSETKSLPFKQPRNLFDFNRMMDEGMIFLVNLSSLGREQSRCFGGAIISSIACAAGNRCKDPGKRKLFNVYIDESHLFDTDATERMLIEARKYNVSITTAHQNLTQYAKARRESLLNVHTTITFGIGASDAADMKKKYLNRVSEDEFIDLGLGEALVKCGSDIVKIKTLGVPESKKSFRNKIIDYSHKHYYKTRNELTNNQRIRFRQEYRSFDNIIPEYLIKSYNSGKIGNYDVYD